MKRLSVVRHPRAHAFRDRRRATAPEVPRRPVHTYSIVARDPATGEMGVAVQSHWFSVGRASRGPRRESARSRRSRSSTRRYGRSGST